MRRKGTSADPAHCSPQRATPTGGSATPWNPQGEKTMSLPHLVVSLVVPGLMFLGAGVASGQGYPNKPIRIVVGAVGGGNDFAARLIAQGMSGSLGQQVIVDNR